jgi:hypothetical protein
MGLPLPNRRSPISPFSGRWERPGTRCQSSQVGAIQWPMGRVLACWARRTRRAATARNLLVQEGAINASILQDATRRGLAIGDPPEAGSRRRLPATGFTSPVFGVQPSDCTEARRCYDGDKLSNNSRRSEVENRGES